MALKGLDIFKLSPKKNCKECGFPTCMAFCMKVAQGAAALEKCPYFSPEAVEKLAAASTPPMATVRLGAHLLGGETVLFRHEKTLVHENLFAVSVDTSMDAATVAQRLTQMQAIDYDRIGQRMFVEAVCVRDLESSPQAYDSLVEKTLSTGRAVLLHTQNPACAEAALRRCAGQAPMLWGVTPDNYREMTALSLRYGASVAITVPSLSALSDTVRQVESLGQRQIFLDVTGTTAKETLKNAVLCRRSALQEGERSLGYPSVVDLPRLTGGDPRLETAYASLFVEKYGSVIVLEQMSMAQALPLFGLRQNIYTDPQKPMKVESKCYPLNGADADSPCVVTVDFALTYFLVRGEIERSGVPVNLLILDASGMSVLTAWAAGKFSAATVREFMEREQIEEQIHSRTLILPGKVSVLQEEIQEALPRWNVVVGTQEAVELPQYLRSREYEAAARAVEAGKSTRQAVSVRQEQSFEELVRQLPPIEHLDFGVTYKGRNPASKAFIPIGERIHCISPSIRAAMDARDPEPILKRAAQQIAAGAVYLDVNIGPAEQDGPQRMMWAVRLLQENFDQVPLALDTSNRRAIEAGIRVYDRRHGKPIINSADAGSRIEMIDLAAANDAICIALCSADGIARDNEERLRHCHTMLERGLSLGMSSDDLWFDPLFLVIKGMQDKQMEVLEAIGMLSREGLKTTGGLSNPSNGAPKALRPILDSALLSMAMMQGLSSAIVNPCDRRLMETLRACDILKNNVIYSDSFLD